MPNIPDILIQAFNYTKNHKFLWFFGFLLSGASIFDLSKFFQVDFKNYAVNGFSFYHLIRNPPDNYAGIIVVIFILALLVFALGILARTALLNAAVMLSRKEQIGLRLLLKRSQKHFFRVFLSSLAMDLVLFFIAVWMFAPGLYVINHGYVYRGAALTFTALCIFLPLLILISLLNIFTGCFIVAFNMHIEHAVKSAFDLISRFFSSALSMLAILFLINLGVTIVCISLLGFVGVLAYGTSILLKSLSVPVYVGVSVLFFLLLGIVLLSINAILNVFTNIAWTLFFLEIVKAIPAPKSMEEIKPAPEPVV